MRNHLLHYAILFCLVSFGAACGRAGDDDVALPTEVVAATTASTAIPTVPPVAIENEPLLIWLPDVLTRPLDETAYAFWEQSIRDFENSAADPIVDWRIKAADGVGGNLATLQSANEVAPAAIPDLMLLRGEELIFAADAGLIQAWPDLPQEIADLPSAVREGGERNGVRYGLPNSLILTHLVYDTVTINEQMRDFSFAGIRENEIKFRLPLGESPQIRELLVSQLMVAQEELQDDPPGRYPAVALAELFDFYESTFSLGLIIPEGEADQRAPAWLATSAEYLWLHANGEGVGFAPIPNRSGSELALVDAWYWVLPSAKVNRHPVALEFALWMLDVERQKNYMTALNTLPARNSAREADESRGYLRFVEASLAQAESVVRIDESLANLILHFFIAMSRGELSTEAVLAAIEEQYQPNP